MRQKILSIAVMAIILGLCGKAQAQQSLEVLSPYVVKGEAEFEQQGELNYDRSPAASGAQDYIGEFGYSPTTWWRSELESEWGRAPGGDQKLRNDSLNSENTFELTNPGEYWADLGAFAEIDFSKGSDADNAIFGLLVAKTVGRWQDTADFLLHKDFGGNQGLTPLGFAYSDQAKYLVIPAISPGFEIYGDTGGKESFADQQFSAGPGIFGKFPTYDGQGFKYEIAYLRGATPATPDSTLRWKMEYEFYF